MSHQARRPGLPARRTVTAALPIFIAAALIITACQPGVDQPGAQASASPVEASPSPLDTWGPLAVIPPQDGFDTLRAEGTLRIADPCVFLESRGELTLLYWPADRATWSEESRAITFENFGQERRHRGRRRPCRPRRQWRRFRQRGGWRHLR